MEVNHALLLLRFVAIILITNSHLDSLYPDPIYGTGGALGNSIFFFISAVGITLSNKPVMESFVFWFKKRASRVIPPLWLVLILLICLGKYDYLELSQVLLLFIFPKEFWFLPALMVMYIPLYYVVRNYSFSLFVKLIILMLTIYLYWYAMSYDPARFSIEDFGLFKSYYYFIIMILGVYVGNNIDTVFVAKKYDFLMLLLVTALYFGFKAFLLKTEYYEWQFIVQMLTIPWLIYLARFFSYSYLGTFFKVSHYGKLIITIVASLTLEIYLMQSLIYTSPIVINCIFPINLFVFIILVVPSAFVLKKSTVVIKIFLSRLF